MARVDKTAQIAEARERINALHAGGMSYKEIGRRLNRDSSLISQVAHGKPKGANLVGGLREIQGGATAVNVPRRTTKAGTEAKTRRGVHTIPGTSNISINTKTGDKTILKGLNQISSGEKYVKWRLGVSWVKTISDRVYKNSGIDGHLPKGWTSQDLVNHINNNYGGNARAALKDIALSQNQGKLTSAGAVTSVHIYTTD